MNWLRLMFLRGKYLDGGAGGGAGDPPPGDPPADDPPKDKPPAAGDPPPQDPPKPKPEETVDFWRDRFNGLNKKYQDELGARDTKIESLTASLGAAEGERADLQKQVESGTKTAEETKARLKELDDQSKDLAEQVKGLEKQKERSDLILSEFPELAAFEANGLIPEPTGDDQLTDVLTKFKETLTAKVGDDIGRILDGATPPGGGPIPKGNPIDQMTDSELYSRVMQLAGSQDAEKQAEYQRLNEAWIERTSKAAAAKDK